MGVSILVFFLVLLIKGGFIWWPRAGFTCEFNQSVYVTHPRGWLVTVPFHQTTQTCAVYMFNVCCLFVKKEGGGVLVPTP